MKKTAIIALCLLAIAQLALAVMRDKKKAVVPCDGRPVSSGVYFYKLVAGGFTQTKKMVVLK